MALSGCETMDALDKSFAKSINIASQTQSGQPEQPEQPVQVQTVTVKSGFKTVNVRQEPSKQAPVVTKIPGGMEVAKIDENEHWIKVKLDMEDGSQTIGWISNEVVETKQ
jgi:SH3-like domain-containing protein